MRQEIQERRWLPWATRNDPTDQPVRIPDFASVYATHIDFVFATLQRLGARGSDLEDLLQKVFLDIHHRLHTYDPTKSLEGWIYGICKNEVSNDRRLAHRRREVTSDEPIDMIAEGSACHAEELLDRREERQTLDLILDMLDLDKRIVFVMFEVDELSCDEIAQSLGIPLGTVYSRLHSARKAFQKAVERHQAIEARKSRGS